MEQQKVTLAQGLRVTGAFATGFSVIAGLVVAFALPSRCSFLSGLELLMLGLLFLVGVIGLIAGLVLSRRRGGSAGGALTQPATSVPAGSSGPNKTTMPEKFWQERQ